MVIESGLPLTCPPQSPAELPVTVKLPLVLLKTMPPFPPLAETVVNDIVSGVVPVPRVIRTASALVPAPPLVVIVPLVAVMFAVLSVASKPL